MESLQSSESSNSDSPVPDPPQDQTPEEKPTSEPNEPPVPPPFEPAPNQTVTDEPSGGNTNTPSAPKNPPIPPRFEPAPNGTVPDEPLGPIPPPIPPPPLTDPMTQGSERKGCLNIPDWFFRLLKYLLLLLLIIWLFRQCDGYFNNTGCEDLKEELRKSQQLDSLRADSLTRLRNENRRNSEVVDSLRKSLIRRDSLRRFTKKEEKLREELKAISEKIYFYGGKDEIREESLATLEKLEKLLNENPSMRIEIRGFYNGTPDRVIDRSISLRRALKVKELLVEGGIDPERLVPADYGNSNPVDDIDELKLENGMQYNRNMRVEFEILRD